MQVLQNFWVCKNPFDKKLYRFKNDIPLERPNFLMVQHIILQLKVCSLKSQFVNAWYNVLTYMIAYSYFNS